MIFYDRYGIITKDMIRYFLISLLFMNTAYAFPKAIDVKHLYVEGIWNTYSSFIISNDGSGDTAQKSVNLGMELDFFKYIFINPRIVSFTDHGQFRLVGLEYQAGLHLGKYVDVFYAHLSHHLLDAKSRNRFDQFDGFGVRLNLIKK